MSNTYQKGFVWVNQTKWAKKAPVTNQGEIKEELNLFLYQGDETKHGCVVFTWVELSGKLVPKMHVYDDSWGVLCAMPQLLVLMNRKVDQNITANEFVEELLQIGFTDHTIR